MKYALLIAIASLSGCILDFDDVGPQGSGAAPATGGSGAGVAGGEGPGGTNEGGSLVACEPSACVAIPDGFEGVVHLRVGDQLPSTPACSSGEELLFEGNHGLSFDQAECNCGCVEPAAFCTLPVAKTFAQQSCNISSPSMPLTLMPAGGCTPLPKINNAAPQSLSLPITFPQPPNGATCESNGMAPTRPDPSFEGYAQGCGFSSEGCEPGTACAAPSTDFSTCFYRETRAQDDDLECPANMKRFQVLRESDMIGDSRDCNCDCDLSGAPGCDPPTWMLFADSNCATATTDTTSGACHTHAGGIGAVRVSSTVDIACGRPTFAVSGEVAAKTSILACCL